MYLLDTNVISELRRPRPHGAVWKFKAIGYDADGAFIPGGGPLTDPHNTCFAVLDEAVVSAALSDFC